MHRFKGKSQVAQRQLTTSVRSLFVDRTGTLWFSTHNGLLSIQTHQFLVEEFLRHSTDQGLMGNIIECCLIDHENSLWIAQPDRGVSILAEKQFWIFPFEGIPETANNGRAAADTNGHFWAATAIGLEEIWQEQNGEWKTFRHTVNSSEGKGSLSSLRSAENGRLWVHTRTNVYEMEIEA